MTRIFALAASVSAVLMTTQVGAVELKVISAGAVRSLIAGVIEDYSRQTGHTFDFTIGTTGQLRELIASGKPADLVIVSGPLMEELEKTGKLTPGSRTDLGRIGIGVVIREGAAAPDVSTPDALKKALVEARSVSYTTAAVGGTSGIHVRNLLNRFGISEMVEKKSKQVTGGRDVAEAVARGEAEIGITLISEIVPVKGAKLAAPLPEQLQLWTLYASAIPASSTDPANARAFISHFTSPAMAERWKAAGFAPPQ